MGGICALCGRQVAKLTEHHLIPRMRHRSRRTKRLHDREARNETISLCSPCHRNLHCVLTEKELADEYNSLDRLAAHEEIAKFIAWIRKRPAGTAVPVRRHTRRSEMAKEKRRRK